MSLINDALKRAQRQRTDEPGDSTTVGGIAKRGAPRSAKSIVALGIGAVALVVVSVGLTIYLVNRRPAAPPPEIASAKPAASPATVTTATSHAEPPIAKSATLPAVSPPPLSVAAVPEKKTATPEAAKPAALPPAKAIVTEVKPATVPVAVAAKMPSNLAPATAETAPVNSAPTMSTTALPSSAAPPEATPASVPAPIAQPDERIHVFIDALRIAGVKASGADSRVLMNDRVYRVNDIVDRTLSVRLIKVEPNNLTFSDANGVIYVRYF